MITISSSSEDDTSHELDFSEALQILENIANLDPKELDNFNYFFDVLIQMIKKNQFCFDPAYYVYSGFLSNLITIVDKQERYIHSFAFSVIYELSKYKEVVFALHNPDTINLLFSIASDRLKDYQDNKEAILILKEIVPLAIEGDPVLNYPVDNFAHVAHQDCALPYFIKLLECNPMSESFRPIIQFLNDYIYFAYYREIVKIVNIVLPVRPEEINFLIELQNTEYSEISFLRKLVQRVHVNDYKCVTSLLSALYEPLIRQINDNEEFFKIIEEEELMNHALHIYLDDSCEEEEFKSLSIQFLQGCVSNDVLHDKALKFLNHASSFTFIDNIVNCPYRDKLPLLIVIINYMEFYGYNAVGEVIYLNMLEIINELIPDHTNLVIRALDVILKEYSGKNQTNVIIDIINKTDIIQDLEDAYFSTDGDEEAEKINQFLEAYEQISK